MDTTIKPIINIFDKSFAHAKLMCNGDLTIFKSKYFNWNRNLQLKKDICFYTDSAIGENISIQSNRHKINVGLLIEPYSVSRELYDFVSQIQIHAQYDIILTHCQSLINCNPNIFKYYPFGGTWIFKKDHKLHNKSKNISIIASNKKTTYGHKLRHETIKELGSKLDIFGRDSNFIKYKGDALIPYRYSIVIENDNNEYFFSEKLIDCLITGTVPIYWGTDISNFFDMDGIIEFKNIDDLKLKIGDLTEEKYNQMLPSIQKNIQTAKKYIVTEDNIWNILMENFIYNRKNDTWRKKLQIYV